MIEIISNYLADQDYQTIVRSVPICTVDIVLFSADLSQTLLFKRNNKPLKDVYFTAGGRLFKNEDLADCAIRQAKRELGLEVTKDDLIFAGSVNEIFADSAFEGVNYHTLNSFFGYILPKDTVLDLDTQHTEWAWFSISDPDLHPLVQLRIKDCIKVLYKN